MPRKMIEGGAPPREPDAVIPPRRSRTRKPRQTGEAEQGVLNDLESYPEDIRRGAIAANMLLLARDIDSGAVEGRDRTAHFREIRQSQLALREMAPGERKGDTVDELGARRAARLQADAGA